MDRNRLCSGWSPSRAAINNFELARLAVVLAGVPTTCQVSLQTGEPDAPGSLSV
jgi:hypothetical protein